MHIPAGRLKLGQEDPAVGECAGLPLGLGSSSAETRARKLKPFSCLATVTWLPTGGRSSSTVWKDTSCLPPGPERRTSISTGKGEEVETRTGQKVELGGPGPCEASERSRMEWRQSWHTSPSGQDRGWMHGRLVGAGRLQVEEGRRRS